MGNCCGGDDKPKTDRSPLSLAASQAASQKKSAAGTSQKKAPAKGSKKPATKTRPPPPSHNTKPKVTETIQGLQGVIVHKDGQRMRKPAMQIKMDIPEGPGMLANPQQIQQAADQPVKIEHVLELPPKAVRGPPPLTPFPEPPKTNVVTQMADPPMGWSHYDTSSTTSTSTNDIIAKIPLIGYGMEKAPSSSSSSDKGAKAQVMAAQHPGQQQQAPAKQGPPK